MTSCSSLRQIAVSGVRRYSTSAIANTRSTIGLQMAEHVDRFAAFNPTALTLEHFVNFGTKKNSTATSSFSFLTKELPVRFANIMKEFYYLPEQLHNMPSVQAVEQWYEQSFKEILQFNDCRNINDVTLTEFKDTLSTILRRHSTVVETMAQGVLEMKEQNKGDITTSSTGRHLRRCVQYFLDRFYLNRIGLRMLINQHMLMYTELKRDGDHVGAIDVHCDVHEIAEDAFKNARFLCEKYYMASPDCEFICRNPYDKEGGRITLTYVPAHLYHMLFELLKNSLRAVMESHEGRSNDLPKVKVLICKGRSDVTIKVSDQGGGIRRSELGELFDYTYSTAPHPTEQDTTPLAGYGYGLPLSYLYARYFNGDLWLNSVDGFGTDATLCLKLLPAEASEVLPIYNKTSMQKYTGKPIHPSDWSDPLHNPGISLKRTTVGH